MIGQGILMRPKEIGIVGFENVVASHLILPADAFAAAFLEDGFGGRIPCYKVWTIGLTKECFVSESGLAFRPQKTLGNAPPLDTIIVPGGRLPVYASMQAQIQACVGDKDSAIKLLASVIRQPAGPSYGELKLDPSWDDLRVDPRFEALVAEAARPPVIK